MEKLLLLLLLAIPLANASIKVDDYVISDEEIQPLLGWGTGGGWNGGGGGSSSSGGSTTTSSVEDCVAIARPGGGVNCSVVCPLLDPPDKSAKLLSTNEQSVFFFQQSLTKIGYYEHCCSTTNNGSKTECTCCLSEFEECINGKCQCSVKCSSSSFLFPSCQGCENNRCISKKACPGSESCVDFGKECPSCENSLCKNQCKQEDPTSTACCNVKDNTCSEETGNNCLCCPVGTLCSASLEISTVTELTCLCTTDALCQKQLNSSCGYCSSEGFCVDGPTCPDGTTCQVNGTDCQSPDDAFCEILTGDCGFLDDDSYCQNLVCNDANCANPLPSSCPPCTNDNDCTLFYDCGVCDLATGICSTQMCWDGSCKVDGKCLLPDPWCLNDLNCGNGVYPNCTWCDNDGKYCIIGKPCHDRQICVNQFADCPCDDCKAKCQSEDPNSVPCCDPTLSICKSGNCKCCPEGARCSIGTTTDRWTPNKIPIDNISSGNKSTITKKSKLTCVCATDEYCRKKLASKCALCSLNGNCIPTKPCLDGSCQINGKCKTKICEGEWGDDILCKEKCQKSFDGDYDGCCIKNGKNVDNPHNNNLQQRFIREIAPIPLFLHQLGWESGSAFLQEANNCICCENPYNCEEDQGCTCNPRKCKKKEKCGECKNNECKPRKCPGGTSCHEPSGNCKCMQSKCNEKCKEEKKKPCCGKKSCFCCDDKTEKCLESNNNKDFDYNENIDDYEDDVDVDDEKMEKADKHNKQQRDHNSGGGGCVCDAEACAKVCNGKCRNNKCSSDCGKGKVCKNDKCQAAW